MIKPARSLFLVLAVVSLAVACDDGGDEAPAPVDMARDTLPPMLRDMNTGAVDATVDAAVPVADISIEPRSLMLLADVGEASAPGALTLSNVGTAPLTVQAVTLTPADGPFRLEPAPALPATLMPGERLMVSVIYQPQDEGPHSATLAVVSDDPDEGMISLMVNGRVRETCIRAMPGSVNLGTVEPGGESGRFRVQVANCGDRPIEVQAVRLDGADDFQWATERGDDPTGLVLRAGDLLLIQVWYTNNNLPPGEAAQTVLVIETDAPTAPSLRVNVRAEGGAGPGCAVVLDPGMLDFDILR
ncbi:MAG: choice-of-anchor D domain-containing protein, partial [Myxococcales bacterium]|nr:choice-of-anchor D domain-containing protein [Myxococcales bacterium]